MPSQLDSNRSKMTEDERNTSIVELTDVISTQLGVRERLEAIRIINPQSAVSPTDGEVAIGKLVVEGEGGVHTRINPLWLHPQMRLPLVSW